MLIGFLALFCLGALTASSVSSWLTLLLPLFCLMCVCTLKYSKNYLDTGLKPFSTVVLISWLLFVCMGIAWVKFHYQYVSQQALSLDQGRVNMQLTGRVARISDQGYRLVFIRNIIPPIKRSK